ncbi:MAG: putative transcriptional regulatory protein pdtaR [Verrucomicrobiae bacterium]|nr:putative transcriptional regulatory protein pdtaR [Verrucomicrobiae bacterium]
MKQLRVVIADDDGVTLMVLKKILTVMGHSVVGEAGDGEQAVALANDLHPDLCILDIRMPKMEGIEAAKHIQAHRPTPVIIVSAHTETGLGSEAAAAGAHAYLVKPFAENQLKPAIELALTTFEKSQELTEKLQQANEALESRKVVERAKGILMRQTGLDEEAAYLRLQKTARNENRKLIEVARAIILAEQMRRDSTTPEPPPPRGYTRPSR